MDLALRRLVEAFTGDVSGNPVKEACGPVVVCLQVVMQRPQGEVEIRDFPCHGGDVITIFRENEDLKTVRGAWCVVHGKISSFVRTTSIPEPRATAPKI